MDMCACVHVSLEGISMHDLRRRMHFDGCNPTVLLSVSFLRSLRSMSVTRFGCGVSDRLR